MPKISSVHFVLLICALFLLLSVQCTRFTSPTLPCEEIAEGAIQPLAFSTLHQQDVPRWIMEHHQVQEEDIFEFESGNVMWEFQDRAYYGFAQEDSMVLAVSWMLQRPTSSEVVECFGTPRFYQASLYLVPGSESDQGVVLRLWYPDQGIVAHFEYTGFSDLPPSINDRLPLWYVIFVQPGTKEEVVDDVFTNLMDRRLGQTAHSLNPWPGAWSDVVVEN